MDFVFGLVVGSVGGPFIWELLKWGYNKLKKTTAE